MKSFYEMWRMLEDYDAWLQKPYQDEQGSGDVYFSKILGEDEGEPFSLEVDIKGGDWAVRGGIWVLGYVPNGSENPASGPVAYTAGQKDQHGRVSENTGTDFTKPGKKLELLPASIRAEAIAWVNDEVRRAIEDHISRDPRDDYDRDDRDDYNPDPDGHGYWDSYWSAGPGRDR